MNTPPAFPDDPGLQPRRFLQSAAAVALSFGAGARAQAYPARPIHLIVPFSAGGLLSIGRLTSTLFPMFLACAAVLPAALAPALIALLAMLQGLVAVLFYTWRGIY